MSERNMASPFPLTASSAVSPSSSSLYYSSKENYHRTSDEQQRQHLVKYDGDFDSGNPILWNLTSSILSAIVEETNKSLQRSNSTGGGNDCRNFDITLRQLSDTFNQFPSYYRPSVLIMYILVSCFGACGNLLVITAVLRNPQMRIPRNYFIINLAISDFLLCTVTVPFMVTLMMNTFWSLGELTCKFVSTSQGINTFVSTMSITAIGFDRYWVILFPTKTNQQRVVITICFIAIWTLSVVFALPLFSATILHQQMVCSYNMQVCYEKWDDMPFRQDVYSIGCMLFQYLLPITMLSFLYGRIIFRLKGRASRFASNRHGSQFDDGGRRRSVETRQRRMNILLVCIVLMFAISWLPFNIYNTLVSYELVKYNVPSSAMCHVIGVLSSCINPILYGVFNDNFYNEFKAIFMKLKIIPAYLAVRHCCRKTLGFTNVPGSSRNRRSTSTMNGRTTSCNNNNNTVITANEPTLAPTVLTNRRDSRLTKTSQKRKDNTPKLPPPLIINNDNDNNDNDDNANDKLVVADKLEPDDTTAMLPPPYAECCSPTNTATNNCSVADSCGSSGNLETGPLLDETPEIDITVVSANTEDTLPLCRRNLINGLNSKHYLLKTDLV